MSEIAGSVNLTNVTFTALDLTEAIATSTTTSLMKSQAEAEERGEAITPSLTKAYIQNMNVIPANCFSFTPNNFSVPAGSSVDVQATLTLPSASIPSGTYSGNIYVNSSGGNVTISVTAIVTSVNTSTGTGTAYFVKDNNTGLSASDSVETALAQSNISLFGAATKYINSNEDAKAGTLIVCDSAGATLASGTTAYTITLPTGNDGDLIRIMDGSGNAQNRPILVDRNGNNIDGAADDLTCDVNYFDIKLVFNSGNWSLGGK